MKRRQMKFVMEVKEELADFSWILAHIHHITWRHIQEDIDLKVLWHAIMAQDIFLALLRNLLFLYNMRECIYGPHEWLSAFQEGLYSK